MSRTQAVPAHMETHIRVPDEVVGTFSSPKLRHEGANCEVETTNGSLGRLSQVVLEFAVRQLDWLEVGRVLRQIVQCRPRFLDRLLDAGDLVAT
jgi:hypothetical protein